MFSNTSSTSRIPDARKLLSLCLLLALLAVCATPQSTIDFDEKTFNLFQVAQGKITVVIFVRTDCPVSNRYAPLLQQLNDIYSDKAKFWLVYPDRKTTSQQIADHLRQFHLSIHPLRDPHHSLVKLAKATITPEADVFDSQGKLLYHGRIDNLYVDAGRARPAATTHELKDAIESAAFGKIPMPAFTSAVGCYISDLE